MSKKLKAAVKALRGLYPVIKEQPDFECVNLRHEYLDAVHQVELYLDKKCQDQKRQKPA